ncbi:MAG TPA: [FeFe] hydrogenase H-cluster maturation GTPase HydF [Deltaproteobacteria bacterium]|nr:[FeFe] hydrogenase H-cluster maturation GTPase HydF [Deltaproteobacteria bacterium]
MNTTPAANRLHIGIFGRRNAGKSSFVNALTGQTVSIVSPVAGTTTDPVGKAMEIDGIGPVYIYDTAGIDDTGELGSMRVQRTMAVMKKVNVAVLVTTASGCDDREKGLLSELSTRGIPALVVVNKIDLEPPGPALTSELDGAGVSWVAASCVTREGIDEARRKLVELAGAIRPEPPTIIGDLINHGDLVLLVVPIDLGAPRGRLILPQVQVIRDILDNDAVAVIAKEREIEYALAGLSRPPALAVCDSQVVLKVSGDLPQEVKLTTFSILFSRLKGDLATFVAGVTAIDTLKDGDRILICEACTHHPLPDDIGRVKIPRWLRLYTGKDLTFETHAGPILDRDLEGYKLAVHCGGCMINRQEMLSRMKTMRDAGVPVTNYGVAISYVHGVLDRVLEPFPYERSMLAEREGRCRPASATPDHPSQVHKGNEDDS